MMENWLITPKREKEKEKMPVFVPLPPIFSLSFPEPGCLVPSLSLDIDRQIGRQVFKY